MIYVNHTTGRFHDRWTCVRWNAYQHDHDVEEVDPEQADLDELEPCKNCGAVRVFA